MSSRPFPCAALRDLPVLLKRVARTVDQAAVPAKCEVVAIRRIHGAGHVIANVGVRAERNPLAVQMKAKRKIAVIADDQPLVEAAQLPQRRSPDQESVALEVVACSR